MTPGGKIRLVSELLDLPLLDRDGRFCAIVDDVELEGEPGKPLRLKALLVGPGAYSGRLPAWLMTLVKWIAGDRITRIPMAEVRTIGSAAHLKRTAADLGLDESESAARRWIPKRGAL